ncbi:MAG: ABC1 kinase family protein [Halopenitus sp.]
MVGFYRRFVRILRHFLPFIVAYLRDRQRFLLFGPPRQISEKTHRERATRLRETMLSLGPTFVKIGQVLSVRPDLVPKVYREELSQLQDTVPEEVTGDPREVLEATFEGDPFEDVREVAGGSLAFVYRANYEGNDVAIKVRRPGIEPLIDTDLRVINWLLPAFVRFVPEQYEYSLRNLADDFERVIFEELDFDRERRIMIEIREDFADDERVRVPEAYDDVSTERVLTMDYLEGTKITDTEELRARGYDPTEYARRILTVYMEMGLVHGVYQADPHPGNLAVNEDGQLVIYDFGMSDRLGPEMQSTIIDLYRSVVHEDVDMLMDALVDLNVLDPDADRAEVGRVLSLVVEELKAREGLTWRDIVAELGEMMYELPFRIPPSVMLLIRVGTVGEGVCRQLDPEFDFVTEVRQYLREQGWLERGAEELVEERREQLANALEASIRLPEKVESLVEEAESTHANVASRREREARIRGRLVGNSVVVASLFVAAALLTAVDARYGFVGFLVAAIAWAVLVRERTAN